MTIWHMLYSCTGTYMAAAGVKRLTGDWSRPYIHYIHDVMFHLTLKALSLTLYKKISYRNRLAVSRAAD